MTIEISNQGVLGQPLTPGEETNSGAAQKHSNNARVETGRPIDSVQLTENAQRIQAITESISTLPVVDVNRVDAAKAKIQSRMLDILGNTEQQLASAEKIADKLIAIEQELPQTKDFDKA